MSDVVVLARKVGGLGHLTLDRQKALNALNVPMIDAIHAALDAWEGDDAIHAVLLDGAGERAFCAGGDLRTLYDAIGAGDHDTATGFLRAEFTLDLRLARYRKPVITVMHGVTMGGGIGVGAHARHRIVTGSSKLAMPEVGIGYVPDVGGSLLLGRAPGGFGAWGALTGATFGAADAIAAGFADMFIAEDRLAGLPQALGSCRDPADIESALHKLAGTPEPARLVGAAWVDRCFAADDVAAVLAALAAAPEADAKAAGERIAGNCPTSCAVALRAMREAASLDTLEACLQLEYRAASRITRRPDFREGVRAAVIDKDREPRWQPSTAADVDPAEVEACFASLGADELRFERVAAASVPQ